MNGYFDTNFWFVILVQFIWFIVVFIKMKAQPSFLLCLVIGLVLSIPYGLAMDQIVGEKNRIFSYYGREDSWSFLLLNWIFSYGLAISTVFAAGLADFHSRKLPIIFLACLVLFVLLIETIYQTVSLEFTLLRMFVLGAILISAAEVAINASGRVGLLRSMPHLMPAFWKFWIFAILTGLVYESANHLFPLWKWENAAPSTSVNLALVVLFGYCALLYPMIAMQVVFEAIKRKLLKFRP